eukprot:727354-Alexandrium_andersonii.AAC.1
MLGSVWHLVGLKLSQRRLRIGVMIEHWAMTWGHRPWLADRLRCQIRTLRGKTCKRIPRELGTISNTVAVVAAARAQRVSWIARSTDTRPPAPAP